MNDIVLVNKGYKDRPAYRILDVAGFFGPDDQLWPEGSEIYFDGEPNEEMEPLNAAAQAKMLAYLEKLDALGRAAAEKAGRPFVGRPRSLDGKLALASAVQRAEMGVLGVKDKTVNTIAPLTDEAPETGLQERRGRGRPRKQALASAA
jgi:hypothetical protein